MMGSFKSGLAWLLFASGMGGAEAIIRGVNLGGWLVTEPWMTPSLFNATATEDEWHLCNVLGKQQCLQTLQQHWSTFYTRDDFVQIKAAGLTGVRVGLGYWAVDLLDYEPYVSGQYPYLIQAVQWCKELGLTVFIDLHGAPGSQNGWEETGLVGAIGFPDNQSNADRTLHVLRNLTTEFQKPIYGGVVTNIEPLNEPIFADAQLKAFYTQAANVIIASNTSGVNFTYHDAFYNPPPWKNYDPNNVNAVVPAARTTLDTHQFWAFPPLTNLTTTQILERICQYAQTMDPANSHIPPTLVGEWSLSTGYTANSTTDASQDQAKRTWFRTLFEAQNAAYTPNGPNQASIGWYFWAWKTEYDIDAWSFRKGIQYQYIPSNVSNMSTYAFPILDNGCINTNFSYTAPASSNASGTSTSSAFGLSATQWLQPGLAVAMVGLVGLL
ncbi:glycoside hydrolase family 5 protein [Baudoinia panamericana UAMH 10762]|uniref:glucan 1,3-beta-glucosidase n=1 Tax=Baudoinia panamericana (strain UAMH 10762) TaxID=717646 RepID=M2NLT6_BAUPA|nr:glycoside hydrolase family 5 protein [Baudoinia panamericana UAMH 10762]EMD00121.1 glycoside hydrolase family 5 protein [Baudoinia panamericana UAMH 10762]